MRNAIISAAWAMGCAAALAATPVDLAYHLTGYAENSGGMTVITDGSANTQWDTGTGATSYIAVKFGAVQTFNRFMFFECQPPYVAQSKLFQIAIVPNPNPAADADWTTITGGAITGNSTQTWFDFASSFTSSGVRIVATDKSNTPDNRMRPREIWVWDNWGTNVATAADVHYENTAPADYTKINNENFSDQAYGGGPGGSVQHQGYTWDSAKTIAGVVLAGGSGPLNEHLTDFHLEYKDLGGNWQTVPGTSLTGNTEKINYFTFATPLTTTGLRVWSTASDSDNLGRVSEFAVFAFVPEPASLSLLTLGSLALLRRRK